jgi:hypothetical protein
MTGAFTDGKAVRLFEVRQRNAIPHPRFNAPVRPVNSRSDVNIAGQLYFIKSSLLTLSDIVLFVVLFTLLSSFA